MISLEALAEYALERKRDPFSAPESFALAPVKTGLNPFTPDPRLLRRLGL